MKQYTYLFVHSKTLMEHAAYITPCLDLGRQLEPTATAVWPAWTRLAATCSTIPGVIVVEKHPSCWTHRVNKTHMVFSSMETHFFPFHVEGTRASGKALSASPRFKSSCWRLSKHWCRISFQNRFWIPEVCFCPPTPSGFSLEKCFQKMLY